MTFADFLAQHTDVEGFDNPHDADFGILHAIQLARRHPSEEAPKSLLRAALVELATTRLPSAVESAILTMCALYENTKKRVENDRLDLTAGHIRSTNRATFDQVSESGVATLENEMSLEDKIEKLTAAIERNTEALLGGKVPEPAAAAEGRRGRRGDKDDAKDKGPTLDDLKAAAAKFLDQPEGKDGDAEYDKRLAAVFDPLFDKAGVKEVSDLPEKYWPDLLDGIAKYEKDAGGSSRRSRR